MSFRTGRVIRVRAGSLTAVTATATVLTLAGLGGTGAAWADRNASTGGNGPCPNSATLDQFMNAENVGYAISTSGSATTYSFYSMVDEKPERGVPGLIAYCVYPSSGLESVHVDAFGDDGSPWIWKTGQDNFAFIRPRGNKSNIPLDGTGPTRMGTATWKGLAPTDQRVLLHINDPGVCASLYPDKPSTCFVIPNLESNVCDQGADTIAYNAMPFGVVNCSKPSWAFEARQTNEFGNGVVLKAGTGRTLDSLQVLFVSYACSLSGFWDARMDGGEPQLCESAPGATFTHSITARIYAVNGGTDPHTPGALLATATQDFSIPYRPSADPDRCTDEQAGDPNGARWFNPVTGGCQYSISKVLTFTDWGSSITLPDTVIWTVAFNTTHYGYDPIRQDLGEQTCWNVGPGCPYDSLNVGTMTFVNAPYAGSDDDADVAYVSAGGPTQPLEPNTTAYGPGYLWPDYTPLAAITTRP